MKSNNFDIIKDKFDRVEPEIPYSMDSKFIKEMILNKQKHKVIKYKKVIFISNKSQVWWRALF